MTARPGQQRLRSSYEVAAVRTLNARYRVCPCVCSAAKKRSDAADESVFRGCDLRYASFGTRDSFNSDESIATDWDFDPDRLTVC